MDNTGKRDDRLFEDVLAAGRDLPGVSRGFEERVMRGLPVPTLRNPVQHRRGVALRRALFPAAASVLFLASLLLFFLFRPFGSADPDVVKVSFTYNHPGAADISMVGDFNRWRAGGDAMQKVNGRWKISKILRKGKYYKYAFMVNGDRLVNDKRAGQFVDDGFGGKTSVIFVN